MSKLRSLNTAFWSDPFIEDLTPTEKLLYIYLITNSKTNMLGIYEVSIRKISFETGINKPDIEKALKGFERLGKVKYKNNYIILVNYLKHQKYNANMKKSAIDSYNNLPKDLIGNDLNISKDNPLEGFETLCEAFGMVRKVEVEKEIEKETEDKYKTEKETIKEIIGNEYEEIILLWLKYKSERKEKYKETGFKTFCNQLKKFSNGKVEVAKIIIEKSMANNYAGIFELKNNTQAPQPTQVNNQSSNWNN